MVTQHIIAYLHNFSVHLVTLSSLAFSPTTPSRSVERISASHSVPAVLIYSLVVFGIDYCVFAFCQRDSSKGVAIPNPPIQKNKRNDRPFDKLRDVNNYVDNPLR